MAYVEVGLDYWVEESRPLTVSLTDDFVVLASFPSKAYTPEPRGAEILLDIDDIQDVAVTTDSVTVLNLESSGNDFIDIAIADVETFTVDGYITNVEWRQRITDTAPYYWFPLDEGTGTTAYDASGNGRNGTFQGVPITFGTTDITSSYGTASLKAVTRGSWPAYDLVGPGAPLLKANVNGGFTSMCAVYIVANGSSDGVLNWYGVGPQWSHTTGFTVNIGPLAHSEANTVGRWYLYFWWYDETTNKAHGFVNGKTIQNSGVTIPSWPSGDSTILFLSNFDRVSQDQFQHVVHWDRLLTHEEMMGIVSVTSPGYFLNVTEEPIDSSDDLLDIDIPAAALTLTTVTSTPALEAEDDLLDFEIPDTIPNWVLAANDDLLDIELSATGMFFTTFVDIIADASDLLDFVTEDAILRRSTFPSGTLTTSTVTLTVVAATSPQRTTVLPALDPIVLTVMTRASISKKGTAVIPRIPESVSDTDPAQASGVIIKALMGVTVDMDTPTIIDGKPT
jgi:hypothetical protein